MVEPIVHPGWLLDGKPLSCTGLGRDAAEGDRLAFVARLHADGAESSALYVATLPEPGGVAAWGAGAMLVDALARRRVRPARTPDR